MSAHGGHSSEVECERSDYEHSMLRAALLALANIAHDDVPHRHNRVHQAVSDAWYALAITQPEKGA